MKDERPIPAPKFKLVIENTRYENPRFVMRPQHNDAEAGGHLPTTPIGNQLKACGNRPPVDLQVQEIPATRREKETPAIVRNPNSTVAGTSLAEVMNWLRLYADGNTDARFLAQNALISITGLIAVTGGQH